MKYKFHLKNKKTKHFNFINTMKRFQDFNKNSLNIEVD